MMSLKIMCFKKSPMMTITARPKSEVRRRMPCKSNKIINTDILEVLFNTSHWTCIKTDVCGLEGLLNS